MLRLIPILALAAGAVGCAGQEPRAADPVPKAAGCAPHEALVAWLRTGKYAERRKVLATADGFLIEIFVGPNGTWSVLRRAPGSPVACLIAAGSNWTDDPTWADTDTKETES